METFGKLVLALPGGQTQEFALARPSVLIGRHTSRDIVLYDAKVSRTHARVECAATGCTLIDLKSANGTYLNGQPVERATLAPGDVIKLGDSVLRYETSPLPPEPEVIRLDSEADLDATLARQTLVMTLNDTRAPRLVVHRPNETREVPLGQDTLTIGRDVGNDLVINHPQASRRHARIERRGDVFFIRDLGSTNGTWIGNRRVDESEMQASTAVRIGDAQLIFKPGFSDEELTILDKPRSRDARVRRPVVFVPGLTGSELWLGSELVWPNPRLLVTNPELLALPEQTPLRAGGVIGQVVIVPNLIKIEAYSRIGDYLEESLGYERQKDLLEFGYDWRQDIRVSARRLAQVIENWGVSSPITLIGHSLGTLVSRYYVECLGGDRWVERLVLMGGPHLGAPGAISGLVQGPDLLPFGLMGERLRAVAATFPSCYQILPVFPCVHDQYDRPIDVLSDDSWIGEPRRPLLRAAREFKGELGSGSKVPTISIFGYGLKTVTGMKVERDAERHWSKLHLATELQGDSTVPVKSAILQGSEIHPVQQNHSVLFIDNDVKMRLKLELTR